MTDNIDFNNLNNEELVDLLSIFEEMDNTLKEMVNEDETNN